MNDPSAFSLLVLPQALYSRFGVHRPLLRLFVHYPPSYWHFHVHFVHVDLASPGVAAGKAILLDDVIGACGVLILRVGRYLY